MHNEPETDVRLRLERVLQERLGSSCRLLDAVPVSGGSSRETWLLDVLLDDEPQPMVLQRLVGEPLGDAIPAEAQAAIQLRAAEVGVPVPRVRMVLRPGDGLGSGLVADAVAGESLPKRILRSEEFAGVRPDLARQCGQILAKLHRIDPGSLDGIEDYTQKEGAFGAHLDRCRAILDRIGEPHPVFELVIRWLAENRPRPAGRVLVHGDFRNGNLLVERHGISAVLDWEMAHVGDPLEDLAWMSVRAWRFGVDDLPVGGFGRREDLIDAYVAESGRDITLADLHAWELLGTLRWGIICMLQAARHLDQGEASLELAAIGRRVCETEYDLLAHLSEMAPTIFGPPPRPNALAEMRPALASGQDRPSANRLLEAVAVHLTRELAPTLEGRDRFLTLVAANVCRMVEREICSGPNLERTVAARLATVLPDASPDGTTVRAELAAALRNGSVSHIDPQVVTALGEDVAAKLAVANPGYV